MHTHEVMHLEDDHKKGVRRIEVMASTDVKVIPISKEYLENYDKIKWDSSPTDEVKESESQ